ncbi:hypothetical protein JYU34_009383 [Plutella xylostella]|uniref:DUF4789 domain-containing protein n=1 Tax=Plutella xylostella TaxID=51655 RepID=A0ABQ7QJB1_PLUXY|nr:hypothetical protein JYU34_009383 [Plutella xylostella]
MLELANSLGPCPKGHTFSITQVSPHGSIAACACKSFHARAADGACYRLYTRGPCEQDEMIARGGRCIKVPCARGRLYVPERRRCYRPGAPEPCPLGEVVAFDFDARPALDGLSHNGVCACGGGSCARREPCLLGEVVAFDFDSHPALDGLSHNGVCACGGGSCATREVETCLTRRGAAVFNGSCHILHTQGPCDPHSWLTRDPLDGRVKCLCRPGTNNCGKTGQT